MQASMGPRSADRGNQLLGCGRNISAASMGPRSADRGNRKTTSTRSAKRQPLQWGGDQLVAEMSARGWAMELHRKLQWGRDQLIAEIRKPLTDKRVGIQLQWGRDQLIAEMHQRHVRRSCHSQRLQWGRDQLIAEIRPIARPLAGAVEASMGPRSADGGNRLRLTLPTTQP